MLEEKKVIMLVEDEEDLMFMYNVAFSSADFRILKTSNGKEALECLEKNKNIIDLIILDIIMPEMDGLETLEKIKNDERFKHIPVFLSTNLDNDEDKKQAIAFGASDYLVKSQYTPSEIVMKVKEFFS